MIRAKTSLLFVILAILIAVVLVVRESWAIGWKLSTAQKALADRDTDLALKALLEAKAINPDNGEVHFWLARTYRKSGQLDKVRESLQRADQLGFSRKRIRQEEWMTMAQAGQLLEATRHLSDLLVNANEDGAEVCEAFSNGFFMSSRFAEGLVLLDFWERDYPQDPQPHFFRAKLIRNRNQVSTVVAEHLRKALQLAPKRNDIRLELANTLRQLKEFNEAEIHFKELLKTAADNAQVQIGWGRLLLEKGQTAAAREILERLAKAKPTDYEILLALGQIELADGRNEQAIALFDIAMLQRRHDVELRYSLANALSRLGKVVEAREHFTYFAKASEANLRIRELINQVNNDDADLEARYEISQLLKEYGAPSDRVIWLRSIVELDPTHTKALQALIEHYEAIESPQLADKHRQMLATVLAGSKADERTKPE